MAAKKKSTSKQGSKGKTEIKKTKSGKKYEVVSFSKRKTKISPLTSEDKRRIKILEAQTRKFTGRKRLSGEIKERILKDYLKDNDKIIIEDIEHDSVILHSLIGTVEFIRELNPNVTIQVKRFFGQVAGTFRSATNAYAAIDKEISDIYNTYAEIESAWQKATLSPMPVITIRTHYRNRIPYKIVVDFSTLISNPIDINTFSEFYEDFISGDLD